MTEMLDIARYSGIGQFGPAYRFMLDNDSHAAGSVDRVLMERMIRLCPDTATYLYDSYTALDIKHQPGSRRTGAVGRDQRNWNRVRWENVAMDRMRCRCRHKPGLRCKA